MIIHSWGKNDELTGVTIIFDLINGSFFLIWNFDFQKCFLHPWSFSLRPPNFFKKRKVSTPLFLTQKKSTRKGWKFFLFNVYRSCSHTWTFRYWSLKPEEIMWYTLSKIITTLRCCTCVCFLGTFFWCQIWCYMQ